MNIQIGSAPFSIRLIFGESSGRNQSRRERLIFDSFSRPRRDETLEALSDAQVVAPAALTVDLHSADHRNSFLYVFDYQTKFGDYPQVKTDERKMMMFRIYLRPHPSLLILEANMYTSEPANE